MYLISDLNKEQAIIQLAREQGRLRALRRQPDADALDIQESINNIKELKQLIK